MSYQYPTLGLNTIQMNTLAFPSSINNDNLNMNITKDEEKKEIIHTVNQCDTLIGISLQYNVPLERIKIYNNLHTEDIYFLKELRIPNPSIICFPPYNDEDVMQTEKRQFLLYFSSLVRPEDSRDEKMMLYYLNEADFDIKTALKEYEKDLKFEEEQKKNKKPSNPFQYTKLELKKFN